MWSKGAGVMALQVDSGLVIRGMGDRIKDCSSVFLCWLEIPLWVPLSAIALGLLYWYAVMTFDIFEKMGIPYCKPVPVLGNLPNLMRSGSMANWDLSSIKKFPNRIHGFFQGCQPTLQISDAKVMKQIGIREFSKSPNRQNIFRYDSHYIVRHAMPLTMDDHWRHVRGAISPHLASGKVKNMMYPTISDCGDKLVSHLASANGHPDTIKSYLSGYALDVLLKNLIGIDLDVQGTKDHPFILHLATLFGVPRVRTKQNEKTSAISRLMLLILPHKVQTLLHNLLGWTVFDEYSMEYLDTVFDKVIDELPLNDEQMNMMSSCRKQMVSLDSVPAHTLRTTGDTIWSTAGLLREDIKANSMSLLATGREMIATTMQFMLYALATNQDVQDKLYEELRDEDDDISYERLQKLEYLDWCVNEVLRMYPPVLRFNRVTTDELTVKDITIPKGMQINCLVFAMHRDPEYWPEPEVFKPERFSPEHLAKNQLEAFMPFGIGNRGCVGKVVSLASIKLGVFKLLKNFTIESAMDTPRPDLIKYKAGTGFLQFEDELILSAVPRS